MSSRLGMATAVFLTWATIACAQRQAVVPWPPEDPDDREMTGRIDEALARRLRGFQTLADIQRVAGAKGKITERKGESVSYHWRDGKGGYMLFTVYQDGGIGGGVLTQDVDLVTINNFGAFICEKCVPPVEEYGRRPSWVDK